MIAFVPIYTLWSNRKQLPYLNQFKEKYSKDSIVNWFQKNVVSK